MDRSVVSASQSFSDVKWRLMTAELRRVTDSPAGMAAPRSPAVPLARRPPDTQAIEVSRVRPPAPRRRAKAARATTWRLASGAALSWALTLLAWFVSASPPIGGAIKLS